MRRSALWTVIGLVTSLIASGPIPAAFGGETPDWVSRESGRYPSERYLTGVGSGDSRKEAEDAAYAALSRIFKAEVQQRSLEWEKYLQSDAGGETTTRRDIKMDQLTEVSTRKALENVSIAETYLDEKTQVHYALAVMDRRQASAALRERITALDLEIEERVKAGRTAPNKLERVRALHDAIEKMLIRDAMNTELRIVNPAGTGNLSLNSVGAIRQELSNYLSQHFRITVEVTGPNADRIRTALMEGLNRQGFPVNSGSESSADLSVKGAVDFLPVEMPRGKFVRWTARFELKDTATGQIIGTIHRQGREGHLTAPEAEARAVRVAQQEVMEDLSQKIAGFVFGDSEP